MRLILGDDSAPYRPQESMRPSPRHTKSYATVSVSDIALSCYNSVRKSSSASTPMALLKIFRGDFTGVDCKGWSEDLKTTVTTAFRIGFRVGLDEVLISPSDMESLSDSFSELQSEWYIIQFACMFKLH